MKILRLRLVKYTRLLLANIQDFDYRPSAQQQLILGTNGSGKTSVLFELSPLPADSGAYAKGGFKEIELTHAGSHYVLKSDFKGAPKHSFIKDGEELNQGGTGLVQKDLVMREFNYTAEIHDILTGRLNFTQVGPQKRREWLTGLSSVNYTFAMDLHKQIGSAARDQLGALRHLEKQLTNETHKISTLPSCEGLEERVELLQNELNLMLSSRRPGLPAYDNLQQQAQAVVSGFRNINDRIQTTRRIWGKSPHFGKFSSLDHVHRALAEEQNLLSEKQALLTRAGTELSELEGLIGNVQVDTDLQNIDFEAAILDHETQIAEARAQIRDYPVIANAPEAREDSYQQKDAISNLLFSLPLNDQGQFSRARYEELKQQSANYATDIERLEHSGQNLRGRLAVMDSARDLKCPQCNYVWREGFSEQEYAKLKSQLETVGASLTEVKGYQEKLKVELEEFDDYMLKFRQFRAFVSNYPRLAPFWDHLLNEGLIYKDPANRITALNTWLEDTRWHSEVQTRSEALRRLQELSARKSQMGSMSHFESRVGTIRNEIETLTQEVFVLRSTVSDIRQFGDQAQALQSAGEELARGVQHLKQLQTDLVDGLRNEIIDRTSREHQNQLGSIRHQLTERITLEGIVKDLDVRHNEVRADHQMLLLLAQALSPTDGLIAEQLRGFIHTLITQINSIIKGIWTYDFAVLPCGLDATGLNYRFPIQINGESDPKGDIANGSTAQQAVINFAFRQTVMLYRKLHDFPLFLDEFGSGFDEQHQINAMNYVRRLMDNNLYSQMFFISHYAVNHGTFHNAEILVMDASNVLLSGDYNQHVTFK